MSPLCIISYDYKKTGGVQATLPKYITRKKLILNIPSVFNFTVPGKYRFFSMPSTFITDKKRVFHWFFPHCTISVCTLKKVNLWTQHMKGLGSEIFSSLFFPPTSQYFNVFLNPNVFELVLLIFSQVG